MRPDASVTRRRTGVVVNYVLVLLVLLFHYLGKTLGWNAVWVGAEIAAFLGTIATFLALHMRTHLWTLVHAKTENLDERELQVTNTALGRAYAVFTVLCLSILLVLTLTETRGSGPLGVLLPVSLIYLAHTLPSSVIAWTQRRV